MVAIYPTLKLSDLMPPSSLADEFVLVQDHWRPPIMTELKGPYVALARVELAWR